MTEQATLRTIVVATDFSENAGVALAWAEQLARQHHATLVLVHAFTAEPHAAPEFVAWPQKHSDAIRSSIEQQLLRQTNTARASGVTADSELGLGAASDVVLAAAERRGADLIVAGTRGRTAWKRLLLGSTAARLIRKSRCPVLTVRPKDAGAPRPVRTVLVPTDFSEDAALAAGAATRILGDQRADPRVRIVLLHAYHVPIEATYLPAPVLSDALSAADAKAKRLVEDQAAKLRVSGIRVDTLPCEGDPSGAILEHAKSVGADLIAMGAHGRSGIDRLLLGSTAERVVASAPCPVLTVLRELV